ncbi:hypothetical protein BN194_05100 [Lacticaseibacillus paracasei]|nr:hypothetical protein BN194_05100 [Lacticaseibacillus paracasei]
MLNFQIRVLTFQILIQRTAHRHIHDLNATADTKDRFICRQCRFDQCNFEKIFLIKRHANLGMRFFPIECGVNIRTTRQHETVNQLHIILRKLLSLADIIRKRNDQRQSIKFNKSLFYIMRRIGRMVVWHHWVNFDQFICGNPNFWLHDLFPSILLRIYFS